ncbi:MAG: NAD(P)H-dependent oxidoreductase [Candidatus Moraniibacteriota bacterium]
MLIIYAHFNKAGHCGEVLKTAEEWLAGKGKPYEVLDLYGIGFDPVLRAEEMASRGMSTTDPKLKELQEKILAEREFVFIYPTWWSNVPAVLKGFYDRVFASGFAFRYRENGFPEGLLKGKRALVITTSGGPAVYQYIARLGRSLRVTTSDTLEFCGIRTKSLLIGGCMKLDESKKTEIRTKVARALDGFVGTDKG